MAGLYQTVSVSDPLLAFINASPFGARASRPALPLYQGESGFTLPLIEGESRALPRGRGSLTHHFEIDF
jgi:hypothetical protein